MSVDRFIDFFIPEHYDLFLDICRIDKTFTGKVSIQGEACQQRLSFHQKNLTISSVRVGEQAVAFELDVEKEAVSFDSPVVGQVLVQMEFSGTITDNMTGIYPSYYKIDGQTKEIISTQFESHFAREAFPCIDEPEAKATFDFSVIFDQEEGEIALSNMSEKNVAERQETGVWTFETTPRMSSYLLAFALGDLHGKTVKTSKGTVIGSYATKAHQLSELDFSLDIAKRVIEFYEDYFGVAYPIPQCLHVALPDFSAGAMENWGLITYREVYLLVDENSTVTARQQVALVIAHEVAHQWFGNLVTMKWWDDLWLNESFANMMEYVVIDAIEPTWNIFEDFQTTGVQAALKRDATDSVQSVHVEVHHPDEVNTLFDAAIVYAKGSRLMHMLRQWLGDEAFRAGLKIYFERHQYGNTQGSDLWNALSEASGRDVAAFMDSWLEQPGYPVVKLAVEGEELVISQQQFFIGEHQDKGRLWQIPLNATWEEVPDTLVEPEIRIANAGQLISKQSQPLRLNTGNTAHYLVDYQGNLFDNLLHSWEQLDKISKLQVLHERRLLAEAGVISNAVLVDLMAPLTNETDYAVLDAILYLVAGIRRFVDEGTVADDQFKKLVQKLFVKQYDRLGFEKKDGETDEDELIREYALSQMIATDHADVIEQAQAIYQDYKDRIAEMPAGIRPYVLANQVKRFETDGLVEELLNLYAGSNDPVLKQHLLAAIVETKQDASLDLILSVLKNKDVVKPQDLAAWYGSLLRKEFAQEKVWTWARNEWNWIKQALGGDMSFDHFVLIPAAIFKTDIRLAEYKTFFEPQLDDMALSRNIQMGIRDIESRVQLIVKDKDAVIGAIQTQTESV
ncbi:M1 family metallopeptidase [Streptococcus suis]|nr:M1 family metallopeptidase [Streptococcus suis]